MSYIRALATALSYYSRPHPVVDAYLAKIHVADTRESIVACGRRPLANSRTEAVLNAAYLLVYVCGSRWHKDLTFLGDSCVRAGVPAALVWEIRDSIFGIDLIDVETRR